MKKQMKTKLRLNSQTIRTMQACGLQGVQGGLRDVIQTEDARCDTLSCIGCRACG